MTRTNTNGQPRYQSTKHTLTSGQRTALLAYAAAKGRYWKEALGLDWYNACQNVREEWAGYLQQVRNTLGPGWLHRTTLTQIRNAKTEPDGHEDAKGSLL